jgi:hypothetical protein
VAAYNSPFGVSPEFKVEHDFSPEGRHNRLDVSPTTGLKTGDVLPRAHALGYYMPPLRGSFYFFSRLSATGTWLVTARHNKLATSLRKYAFSRSERRPLEIEHDSNNYNPLILLDRLGSNLRERGKANEF